MERTLWARADSDFLNHSYGGGVIDSEQEVLTIGFSRLVDLWKCFLEEWKGLFCDATRVRHDLNTILALSKNQNTTWNCVYMDALVPSNFIPYASWDCSQIHGQSIIPKGEMLAHERNFGAISRAFRLVLIHLLHIQPRDVRSLGHRSRRSNPRQSQMESHGGNRFKPIEYWLDIGQVNSWYSPASTTRVFIRGCGDT